MYVRMCIYTYIHKHTHTQTNMPPLERQHFIYRVCSWRATPGRWTPDFGNPSFTGLSFALQPFSFLRFNSIPGAKRISKTWLIQEPPEVETLKDSALGTRGLYAAGIYGRIDPQSSKTLYYFLSA